MASRAETKKIDIKKTIAGKQLSIATVQFKSSGLIDTTSAGVRRNPSRTARIKQLFPML